MKKREEQLEQLRRDMGEVAMDSSHATVAADAEPGPSALILTRGIADEEDQEVDSDTDDLDHQKAEVQSEEPSFRRYLEERKRRNQTAATE
uniref:GPN-loop GTPase 1-like n=1 Tax=Pristiophorus japonicus TaxID=55135 RepID=UPI00398E3EE8